eukprot:3606747-Rhodomonas_salina.1
MTAQLRILIDHLAIILQPALHFELRTTISEFETTLHDALASLPINNDTNNSILILFYELCNTFNNFTFNDINLDLPYVDNTVAEPGIWSKTCNYRFLVSEDAGKLTNKLQTVI